MGTNSLGGGGGFATHQSNPLGLFWGNMMLDYKIQKADSASMRRELRRVNIGVQLLQR